MVKSRTNKSAILELQDLISRLEIKGPIISNLVYQKLVFLKIDFKRLLKNSYSTSAPRETISLLRYLYENPRLSEIYVVNSIIGPLWQVWQNNEIGPEFMQLNMKAAIKGFKIHFLFIVDNWLSLAFDKKVFNSIKCLVTYGIEIKIMEFTDVPLQVNDDFIVYFENQSPACITYCDTKQSINEILSMRLILPEGDAFEQYCVQLQSIWNSPNAKILKPI